MILGIVVIVWFGVAAAKKSRASFLHFGRHPARKFVALAEMGYHVMIAFLVAVLAQLIRRLYLPDLDPETHDPPQIVRANSFR